MRKKLLHTGNKEIIILALLILLGQTLFSQEQITLTGKIHDAEKGFPLEGASVIDINSGHGVASDSRGRYELHIPVGEVHLQLTFLGYHDFDTIFNKQTSGEISFYLSSKTIDYEEVKITSNTNRDFISSIRMGEMFLNREDINSLPKLLGEADPIRFLQLTPGVQSSSEGGVGFYVRGGGVDQNLVLYDNALIYNPGHLLGFISVFNPDIITEVSLIKSGIPASFGGRLSSVVQVNPDRGRSDTLSIKGQLGLVASRVTLNRSFNKDRASFILSARRASIDLFIKPIIFPLLEESNAFLKESSYNFYDFNAGLSFKVGSKDHFSISAFYGEDKYTVDRSARVAGTNMNWGNLILTGKWNHVFNENTVLRTTLSRTDYNFDLSGQQAEFLFSLLSSAKDHTLKSNLNYFQGKHKFSFGYELTHHVFTPNKIDANSGNLFLNFLSYNALHAYEGGIFAEDEFQLSDRIGVSLGLRYSFFNQVGPYTEYIYDDASILSDSIHYPSGQSMAFYHHPEPRISLKYQLNEKSSLKASYMHLAQYVHLATSATVSLPTDIWLPSSKDIKPAYGDQVSGGYFFKWLDDQLESSVELYYKSSKNQLEFIRGIISSSLNLTLQDNIAIGKGRSYGAEFFVRKKTGKLTGWAGYTISRSVREFDAINDGRIYPAKFDRRHDVSLAAVYKLNKYWSLSSVFIYVSGNAFTLPVGRYIIQGNLVNQYGAVNNYRMPAYHRLDFSASRSNITAGGNVSTWDLSIYNLYNRANPFYIYFETTGDLDLYQLNVNPVVVSLFPIIPTISWRFEF